MTERSVIVPERYKEVVVDPMAKTREMLFVGAIMNIVESLVKHEERDVHQLAVSIRENVAKAAHNANSTEVQSLNDMKEACTRAFMDIMSLAGKLDINIALGSLRLHYRDKEIKNEVVPDPNEKGSE